ncbi:AraC family transcriptional regulator [Paenibacillus polymyxa]
MQGAILTNEQYREVATHGSINFPIQYYLDDTLYFHNQTINRHWHPELEFALIQEGKVDYWIGGNKRTLEAGDGVFVNTRVIHGYEAIERALVPNIVFSPEFISGGNHLVFQKFVQPITFSTISGLFLNKKVKWQDEILHSLNKVFELMNSKNMTKELDLQILMSSIWRTLYLHQESCKTLPHSSTSYILQTRLQLMLDFIFKNYERKIHLTDIADAAKVSKSEALRCFKLGADITPVEYLIQYRLSKAKELLLNSEKNVTEIASHVGFENVGYFSRMFKKNYGATPKLLRKTSLQKTVDVLPSNHPHR